MKNPEKFLLLIIAVLFSFSVQAEQFDARLDWVVSASYNFMVTGEVDAVKAQPGDRVTRGSTLVSLYQKPFQLEVKKSRAGTETLEPLLFDAKIELSQAEELYDRTVLSQIELQKIEAKYRGLEAQNRVKLADYEFAKMYLEKSSLVAPFDAIVVDNQFIKGQMISIENQSQVAVVLAPVDRMAVKFSISPQQIERLKNGSELTVDIDSNQYTARLRKISPPAAGSADYQAEAEFSFSSQQSFYPGQPVKINLP